MPLYDLPVLNSRGITENKDEGGGHEIARSDEGTPLSECDDEYDDGEMSATDYENYKKVHNEMEDAKKWRLTTGTIVEDALFNFGARCKHEHLAHSFVLDPEDST
ncbi:hypothetical protein BC936DRAFT_141236 [Jimgerdemannia flammicorona]|uniref:Uncharacterized protein n=1 Tax=Jimgerdemannia flammicorona TaxID=994334 RepID=A0A433A2L8_9FUNG|nr:hypothetical protein BC936DRAFT_141236 [Jimgerdemannia flammicorona]